MDLTKYILAGYSRLPKKKVVINSVEVAALYNTSTHRDNKTLGGYEPDNDGTLFIETSLLTNPKELKGELLQMDSKDWRIITVTYGDIVTSLTIQSPDKQ